MLLILTPIKTLNKALCDTKNTNFWFAIQIFKTNKVINGTHGAEMSLSLFLDWPQTFVQY